MDYAKQVDNSLAPLDDSDTAYIARYARGRDYHKVLRKRLQKLADKIQEKAGPIGYRAFVDSAPTRYACHVAFWAAGLLSTPDRGHGPGHLHPR